MRRSIAVLACTFAASACAMIAGLDEPSLEPSDAGAAGDASISDGAGDALGDGAAIVDAADAGRKCTGTPLKSDAFDDRTTDAAGGWTRDYQGDGGVVEISDGGLRIVIPPVTSKVNARRQLEITKPAAKRICASFTVNIVKPSASVLGAYFDAGDTTFGFIAAEAPDASMYTGIGVDGQGVISYVFRDVGGETRHHLPITLGSKWTVLLDADFVTNEATVIVNDREDKLPMIRAVDAPTAMFALGIRNFGPTPEAEATFDDVVVTAD